MCQPALIISCRTSHSPSSLHVSDLFRAQQANFVYMIVGVSLKAVTDTLASNACVSPLYWGNTGDGGLESFELFGQEQVPFS